MRYFLYVLILVSLGNRKLTVQRVIRSLVLRDATTWKLIWNFSEVEDTSYPEIYVSKNGQERFSNIRRNTTLYMRSFVIIWKTFRIFHKQTLFYRLIVELLLYFSDDHIVYQKQRSTHSSLSTETTIDRKALSPCELFKWDLSNTRMQFVFLQ